MARFEEYYTCYYNQYFNLTAGVAASPRRAKFVRSLLAAARATALPGPRQGLVLLWTVSICLDEFYKWARLPSTFEVVVRVRVRFSPNQLTS